MSFMRGGSDVEAASAAGTSNGSQSGSERSRVHAKRSMYKKHVTLQLTPEKGGKHGIPGRSSTFHTPSPTASQLRLKLAKEQGLSQRSVNMEVYGRYKPKLKTNEPSWWSLHRKHKSGAEIIQKRDQHGHRPVKNHWPDRELHRKHKSRSGDIGKASRRDISLKAKRSPRRQLRLHKQKSVKKVFSGKQIEQVVSGIADIDPTAKLFCGLSNTATKIYAENSLKSGAASNTSMVASAGSGASIFPSPVQAAFNTERERLHPKKLINTEDEAMMLNEKNTARQMRYLLHHTHFEELEIRALEDMFHEVTSQTDEMDRHLFLDVAQKLLGLETKLFGEQMFRFFDYCYDGSIGAADWVRGISVIFRGTLDEHIRYCFQIYDCRGEGMITREDVRNLLKGCLRHVEGIDEAAGDGETFDPNNIREIAESVLRKLEEDRKGYITLNSFSRAVQHDPLQIQCLGSCLPDPETVRTTLAMLMDDYTLFETNYSLKFAVRAKNSHWKYLKNAILFSPSMKRLARAPIESMMFHGRNNSDRKRQRRKSIHPSLRYILYGM